MTATHCLRPSHRRVLSLALLASFVAMGQAQQRSTQGQSPQESFQAQLKADWKEALQYVKKGEKGKDPQRRLAEKYFRYYLEHRPSENSREALKTAFVMWGNLSGTSRRVEEAAAQISAQDDVWAGLPNGLVNSFFRDRRLEQAYSLLVELEQRVQPLASRSAILIQLARHWLEREQLQKARQGLEQILAWNASEKAVSKARRFLYEIDNLSIGMKAPLFSARDIDGNLIHLSDLRGKVVLLDFWATTCGPCLPELPYLRRIARRSSSDQFALIAISIDKDEARLRSKIESESLSSKYSSLKLILR